MKICSKCNEERELSLFYKDKGGSLGVRSICKQCDVNRRIEWSKSNKDKDSAAKSRYRNNHIDRINKVNELRLLRDPTYYARSAKLSRERQGEKYNIRVRKWDKEKRMKDPIYKLKRALSNRISSAIYRMGFKKTSKTAEMLGCSMEELKLHLESKFQPGMTWGNHGEWHIDHIVPCSSAKTEDELVKLQHYTNLQPLWATDNLIKSDKI